MKHSTFSLLSQKVLIIGITLLISACVIKPPTSTDYDTSYNFALLKSYAWVTDDEKVSTLDNRRQINAIETTLNQKGFVKASSEDSADFLLKTHVITDKKVDVDRFYHNRGFYPFYNPHIYHWPRITTTSVREYKVGTLVLDIVDPKLKQVIWRGSVSKPLGIYKNRSPEERSQIAQSNAHHMLINFPPQKTTVSE